MSYNYSRETVYIPVYVDPGQRETLAKSGIWIPPSEDFHPKSQGESSFYVLVSDGNRNGTIEAEEIRWAHRISHPLLGYSSGSHLDGEGLSLVSKLVEEQYHGFDIGSAAGKSFVGLRRASAFFDGTTALEKAATANVPLDEALQMMTNMETGMRMFMSEEEVSTALGYLRQESCFFLNWLATDENNKLDRSKMKRNRRVIEFVESYLNLPKPPFWSRLFVESPFDQCMKTKRPPPKSKYRCG